MTQPDLTFRNISTPFATIASVTYVQTKDGGTNLPVLQGENSDNLFFRVYNNWALNSSIANALNCHITTWDGPTSISHTAATLPVSQKWIHVYEDGYGENSVTPGVFTSFAGVDTAVGGSSKYVLGKGTDGSTQSIIRAYSNNNGLGFVEITSYASVPVAAPNNTYNFVITVDYEWTT